MKRKTNREIVEEILEALPWRDRQRVIEAGQKQARANYKPADLAEVERLYYQVLGYSREEIWRRMKMELKLTLECNEDVAMRLAELTELQAERIKANEGKGGWRNLAAPQLIDQLRQHVHELESAVNDLTSGKASNMAGLQAVAKAAADCSNYSFFIADNQDCFVHD